ncbi:MAG: hypothetical protein LZF86_110259 [Nitrospira sp.]|nr:MAG: hypothetical protein LZF86_110259 [Nitrospira sp.]
MTHPLISAGLSYGKGGAWFGRCGLLCGLLLLAGCSGEGPASSSALTTVVSSGPAANLLFKSNFGPGVSLGAPEGFYATIGNSRGGAWQRLIGTDNETGYAWPVAALGAEFSGVQLITVDPIDAGTVGNYIVNEIRTVPGPTGNPVRELFQTVKNKGPVGHGYSQAPLLIKRPWTIGEVTDLYITYWFKHQSDLQTQLDTTVQPDGSRGDWRVQFEFKTGGYNNTSGGDYRITTNVMKDFTNGSLYWRTSGDNQANGPYGPLEKDTYWTEDNRTVPVPVDQWFKFEGYWHRSNGADGRYWAAVNGRVIADHRGPNMGNFGLPITRIFIDNSYSGGYPEVHSQLTGLEIWDGFPCGDGLSCYN